MKTQKEASKVGRGERQCFGGEEEEIRLNLKPSGYITQQVLISPVY